MKKLTGQFFALVIVAGALTGEALAQGEVFVRQMQLTPHELRDRTPRPADTTALEINLTGEILRAGNDMRLRSGLGRLEADPVLAAAAERYSRRMRDGDFFAHVSPDGETLARRLPRGEHWRYEKLGENLWTAQGALDWRAEAIARHTTEDWVLSPSHRDNLLEPIYTHAGVGVAVGRDNVFVTMLYARPYDDPAVAALKRDYGERLADLSGFARTLEQETIASINAMRARAGLPTVSFDPDLTREARDFSQLTRSNASGEGALRAVLDRRAGRTHRLALASWQARGDLIWNGETLADSALKSWIERPDTQSDIFDPGYDQAGIGVAVDGNAVFVSVLLSERALQAATIRRGAGTTVIDQTGTLLNRSEPQYIQID